MTQPDWPLTLSLPDEAATKRLGIALAEAIKIGDVIALSGDFGAGKTSLARAIIQSLAGTEIEVPSPTFTLLQEYPDLPIPIVHYDLNRLRGENELTEIGFAETEAPAAILVEWPDRAGERLPRQSLSIALAVEKSGRRATISGGASWRRRLRLLPLSRPGV